MALMIGDAEKRFFLIDADTDARAETYYGKGWRCVDTMPLSGLIECATVKGHLRLVEAGRSRQEIQPSGEKGPRRVYVDGIVAVAWRPSDRGS